MDPVATLHDAARRYVIARDAELRQRYAQLGDNRTRRKLPGGGWTYTDAARELFPRYNVVTAIRCDVEALVPAALGSLSDARALLAVAAESTRDLPDHEHPVEAAAIADERRRFLEFLDNVDLEAAAFETPLPFRRTLAVHEHDAHYDAFVQQWGRWYGGARTPGTSTRNAVTLHVAAMVPASTYAHLRAALADHGVTRLFELREHGDGYELALELASFTYHGAEGFWVPDTGDWMVHASHESSITFGGDWLIDRMRAALPRFDRFLYRGWDLAAYDVEPTASP